MIKLSKYPTLIFTNHGTALGIAKQISLSIFAKGKLNLRLIWTSEYLQMLNIEIRHKPGK